MIKRLLLLILLTTGIASGQTVAAPTFTPVGGSVTMSTSTPGAGIWYTTDGSTPTIPPGGVPQGTSTGYTPMLNPAVQPPLSSLKNITAYGAVAGGTDNTTAIYNACVAAGVAQSGGPAAQTSGIYVPAGVWYAGNFVYGSTPLNCNIYGQGQNSEIYCASPITNGNNCQMYTTGSNQVWSNFSHQMPFTTRDASNFNISFNPGATNDILDTVLMVGGNAGGVQASGATGIISTNNGVFNTGADCNYHTSGTTNDITDHTYVANCGDDSVSIVSNAGQTPSSNILIQWNHLHNDGTKLPGGRGVAVAGGTNYTVQNNFIDGMPDYSCLESTVDDNGVDTDSANTNGIWQYNYGLNCSGSAGGYGYSLFILAQGNANNTNQLFNGNILSDSANRTGMIADALGSNIQGVTVSNNQFGTTGTAFEVDTSGSSIVSDVSCTGNTQNGTSINTGGLCSVGGPNPYTATGSSLTYSAGMAGTAKMYTGPITVSSGIVKAVAVFPGLTNSSIGSYTAGPTVATPTFSPPSGTTFSSILPVTLLDTTPSSTIYYYTSSPSLVIVINQVPSIVTTVGPSFTDSSGYVWTITSGAQMAINGNTVTNTSFVSEIVYVNGNVWQFNGSNWYEVTSVISSTVPTVTFGAGTTTSPIPTPQSITDTSGYVWTITSGAQVAINGNIITATGYVVQLDYVNGNVWQLNTAGNWYEVLSVTSPSVPTVSFGSATTTSPIPSFIAYSSPINLSISSSITAYAAASGSSNSVTTSATYNSVALTSISVGANQASWGQSNYSGFTGLTANYLISTYFVLGGAAQIPTACAILVGTNTSGKFLDCGIIAAPSPITVASSWLCHSTATMTGVVDTVYIMQLNGCGPLAANGAYWVVESTNDSAMTVAGNNCGSTCTGTSVSAATYGSCYQPLTYGTYTGLSPILSFGENCPGTSQNSILLTTIPALVNSPKRLKSGAMQ